MDSLYEPVPEHQEAKDTATPPESQATTPVSTHVSCGPPDRSMSLVSNISLQSMQCIHSFIHAMNVLCKKTIALYIGMCVFCWLICQFELFGLFGATAQISSL